MSTGTPTPHDRALALARSILDGTRQGDTSTYFSAMVVLSRALLEGAGPALTGTSVSADSDRGTGLPAPSALSETAPRDWKRGDQRVVCAAVRAADEEGRIVTGARHFDAVMVEQIKRSPRPETWRGGEQGFIDQFGKFLTREEARVIAEKQGQILDPNGGGPLSLYSENLY